MKKIIFSITVSLIAVMAQAQKLKTTEVPSAVKDSFTKKFPNAQGVEWSKENDSEFEAEFKNKGNEQSVCFDQSGKWLETEMKIRKAEIPATVEATIAKEFSGYTIEEAELTETSEGAFYEVEVEKDKLSYEVQISKDGKLIKKKEKKEEEEKEDKD